MEIPLAVIDPPPNKEYDQAAVEKMAKKIEKNGRVWPILVKPEGERYAIIDGGQRYYAAKKMGRETIQAHVRRPHKPRPEHPLVQEIATALDEQKPWLVGKVVRTIGADRTREFFKQAQEIEANGGMMTADGSRRRTPGGVFLELVRKGVSRDEKRLIFFVKPKRKKSGRGQNKPKPKPPVDPLTWIEANQYANTLLKHPKGQGKTVELKLIGRPAQVAKAKSCMVAVIEGPAGPKSLPKGLPTPPEAATNYTVFISNKQWKKVGDELKTNPQAELMVKGHPVFQPEKRMTMLLAQSVEVIERKPRKET